MVLCEIEQEVMTHRVYRVEGRDFPKSVILKEEEIEALKAGAHGKVQAAVLKGDFQIKYMVVCGERCRAFGRILWVRDVF